MLRELAIKHNCVLNVRHYSKELRAEIMHSSGDYLIVKLEYPISIEKITIQGLITSNIKNFHVYSQNIEDLLSLACKLEKLTQEDIHTSIKEVSS